MNDFFFFMLSFLSIASMAAVIAVAFLALLPIIVLLIEESRPFYNRYCKWIERNIKRSIGDKND